MRLPPFGLLVSCGWDELELERPSLAISSAREGISTLSVGAMSVMLVKLLAIVIRSDDGLGEGDASQILHLYLQYKIIF